MKTETYTRHTTSDREHTAFKDADTKNKIYWQGHSDNKMMIRVEWCWCDGRKDYILMCLHSCSCETRMHNGLQQAAFRTDGMYVGCLPLPHVDICCLFQIRMQTSQNRTGSAIYRAYICIWYTLIVIVLSLQAPGLDLKIQTTDEGTFWPRLDYSLFKDAMLVSAGGLLSIKSLMWCPWAVDTDEFVSPGQRSMFFPSHMCRRGAGWHVCARLTLSPVPVSSGWVWLGWRIDCTVEQLRVHAADTDNKTHMLGNKTHAHTHDSTEHRSVHP